MAKIIRHNLLPKQKSRNRNSAVEINLYDYASNLWDELESLAMIQRLKEIPQLGIIRVKKSLEKSRYDYVALQLYFHQLIREELQTKLELSYNNKVNAREFREDLQFLPTSAMPTVGDLLQLLTIVYNLGHFYNTFTASRAAIMLADKSPVFKKKLFSSSNSQRFQTSAEKLLREENYHRFHLLNSLLVLERCDQRSPAVIIAQEVLYAYINQDVLPDKSKLHYVFKILRTVRNVSYISYDLQIAETPFLIDLCDRKAITLIFNELLAQYNDHLPAKQLMTSISKLLDDTVYNENSQAICYYRISRTMTNTVNRDESIESKQYYADLWLNPESAFNKSYRRGRDYSSENILKLTFSADDRELSRNLLVELERTNSTRVGYYDRSSGERTILVSIAKNCQNKDKIAFRVLKTVIKHLRRVSAPSNSDSRYLLASKFFLYYLFNENPLVIKNTIDEDVCVLCTRGKRSRIVEIESLLKTSTADANQQHEVEHMLKCLKADDRNDTSITIPASIIVFHKNTPAKKQCEFDGMVIHPMRDKDQVIFFEAKNTTRKPSFAKNCLVEKFDKLNIVYDEDSINTIDYDAIYKLTV